MPWRKARTGPCSWSASLAAMALSLVPQRLPGMGQVPGALSDENVLVSYGTIILCFMSGVLWGFATRANGTRASIGYALSVIPALWAFFMTGGGPTTAGMNLIFGFLGLLALDFPSRPAAPCEAPAALMASVHVRYIPSP